MPGRTVVLIAALCLAAFAGIAAAENSDNVGRRFFSASSFWNQPIPENVQADPQSDHYIRLLKNQPYDYGICFNLVDWTIPVYEVDSTTPRHTVKQRVYTEAQLRAEHWNKFINPNKHFSHGPGFGQAVPIPDNALPSPQRDSHLALVDRARGMAWDMWDARRLPDGTWESSTGMVCDLNGEGVFHTRDFGVKTGESIHFFGPSRAAGVPAIAGLIMYDEIQSGEIRHKLACATPANAFREFVFPACWTDGRTRGGIPEGAVIQLDPALDLNRFDLLPGEKVVARALQRYGMVDVDNSGDFCVYAECLRPGGAHTWEGVLRSLGINNIPLEHFRVLELKNVVHAGN